MADGDTPTCRAISAMVIPQSFARNLGWIRVAPLLLLFSPSGQGRRAWHNLINLESRVDGSPIFLASIGTRIKFSQRRFIL